MMKLELSCCLILALISFPLREAFFFKSTSKPAIPQLEKDLLSIFTSQSIASQAKLSPEVNERLRNIISGLEDLKGSKNPTRDPLIDGTWRLLYTSSPGTNSPIQRTVTGSGVSVYQVVNLLDTAGSFLSGMPDVSNTVCFGNSGRLRVTALASTTETALIEPRKGDGKIFGMNVFGVSSSSPPRDPSERIDFAFQEALFESVTFPVTVPYPVPFKLLGDEAKGWIDNTYLSERIRIARGNKGTLFVLQRADITTDPLAALAAAADVKDMKNFKPKVSLTPPLQGGASSRSVSKKGSGKSLSSVAILFPAQLGTLEDYSGESHIYPFLIFLTAICILLDLSESLLNLHGVKCYTAPLKRIDWPLGLVPSFFSKEYLDGTLEPSKTLSFYFRRIDEAVQMVMLCFAVVERDVYSKIIYILNA